MLYVKFGFDWSWGLRQDVCMDGDDGACLSYKLICETSSGELMRAYMIIVIIKSEVFAFFNQSNS